MGAADGPSVSARTPTSPPPYRDLFHAWMPSVLTDATYVPASSRPELTGPDPEVQERIRQLRRARARFVEDGHKVVIR